MLTSPILLGLATTGIFLSYPVFWNIYRQLLSVSTTPCHCIDLRRPLHTNAQGWYTRVMGELQYPMWVPEDGKRTRSFRLQSPQFLLYPSTGNKEALSRGEAFLIAPIFHLAFPPTDPRAQGKPSMHGAISHPKLAGSLFCLAG